MITTVTTATSAIITTAAATSLTLIAVLTLVSLLIQKELIGSLDRPRAKKLSRALNAAIIPLALVFVIAIVSQVADGLR
jgi:hypothetical protein